MVKLIGFNFGSKGKNPLQKQMFFIKYLFPFEATRRYIRRLFWLEKMP